MERIEQRREAPVDHGVNELSWLGLHLVEAWDGRGPRVSGITLRNMRSGTYRAVTARRDVVSPPGENGIEHPGGREEHGQDGHHQNHASAGVSLKEAAEDGRE